MILKVLNGNIIQSAIGNKIYKIFNTHGKCCVTYQGPLSNYTILFDGKNCFVVK